MMMQTMVILHLFPLVICLKLTIGESVCMASLCEDTLYNIKLHTHVDLDISTKGSENQCPKSKNYILKLRIKRHINLNIKRDEFSNCAAQISFFRA
uniref:Uncharacterized protein n=1 Tax=Romanomermis culicivorax TaxID=13658 RepID=A0A915J372_ROMCU